MSATSPGKKPKDHEPVSTGKGNILRNKIKFIQRMMRFNKTLREESEAIMKLKGQCPDRKLPPGLITDGSAAIQNALELFKKARKADLANEKMPEQKKKK